MWFRKKKNQKVSCSCKADYLCEHGNLRLPYPDRYVPTKHLPEDQGFIARCKFCNIYLGQLYREGIVNCVGERNPLELKVLDTGIRIEIRKEYRGKDKLLSLFLKKLLEEINWETIEIFGDKLLKADKLLGVALHLDVVTPIVGVYLHDNEILLHENMHVHYYSHGSLFVQRSSPEPFDNQYLYLIGLDFPFSLEDDTLFYVCHKLIEYNSEILPQYVHSSTNMLSLDSIVEQRMQELYQPQDRKEKFQMLAV